MSYYRLVHWNYADEKHYRSRARAQEQISGLNRAREHFGYEPDWRVEEVETGLDRAWLRLACTWRKRLVQQAADKHPAYAIAWAVITRHHVDPDVPGWNYHLIRLDWGYEAALRLQQQAGGRIVTLREGRQHNVSHDVSR